MKVVTELCNKTENDLAQSFVQRVSEMTLEKSNFSFLADKEISVSFAVVGEEEIRGLNRIYRKKDEATDVLSFSEFKNISENKEELDGSIFLGEIILCYNYIADFCQKNNIELQEELVNVVAHGMLHLLGFDHGQEMFSLQSEVVKTFLNKNSE